MDGRPLLWRRWAGRYEAARRPRLVLAIVSVVVFLPALFLPLMVDDYRALRQFRAFREGRIAKLDLYAFAREPGQIRAEREAGYFPWWISEDLRFRYFRPVSEASLYLDYLAFGDRAIGYRISSIAWYVPGVWLALAFFRRMGSERLARWAALIYAVAGCHVIPVVFASARCDLISIVFVLASMVMLADFVGRGRASRLAIALAMFLVSLGAKEASVAVCVMPALIYWALGDRAADTRGAKRRAAGALAAFVVIGIAFLAFASAMKSGSNARIMLDPLRAPGDYLWRAPERIVLMLSAWALQFNPMLFCQRERFYGAMHIFAAAGAVVVLLALAAIWRNRRDRSLLVMTAWSLMFLPILACTPPEDRVIGLPSIGLAYVSAFWLTSRSDGRLRWLPAWLYVAVPFAYVATTFFFLFALERKEERQLRAAIAAFGREVRPTDWVFFVNAPQLLDVLWTQDRLDALTGGRKLNVAVLHDAGAAEIEAVSARKLAVRSMGESFLSSFGGLVGRSRTAPPRTGDRVLLKEYGVELTRVENGEIKELLIEFAQPLTADGYRFLELNTLGDARVISPMEFAPGANHIHPAK